MKLPIWRLTLAILILGGAAAVLLSLAPLYLKDWQLRNYLRDEARNPEIVTMTDTALQAQIAGHAQNMGLPVTAPDVQITRGKDKIKMEIRYTVSFQLYQVDLHFHSSAGHV